MVKFTPSAETAPRVRPGLEPETKRNGAAKTMAQISNCPHRNVNRDASSPANSADEHQIIAGRWQMASTKLMPINTSAEYDRRTEGPAEWRIPLFHDETHADWRHPASRRLWVERRRPIRPMLTCHRKDLTLHTTLSDRVATVRP